MSWCTYGCVHDSSEPDLHVHVNLEQSPLFGGLGALVTDSMEPFLCVL